MNLVALPLKGGEIGAKSSRKSVAVIVFFVLIVGTLLLLQIVKRSRFARQINRLLKLFADDNGDAKKSNRKLIAGIAVVVFNQ